MNSIDTIFDKPILLVEKRGTINDVKKNLFRNNSSSFRFINQISLNDTISFVAIEQKYIHDFSEGLGDKHLVCAIGKGSDLVYFHERIHKSTFNTEKYFKIFSEIKEGDRVIESLILGNRMEKKELFETLMCHLVCDDSISQSLRDKSMIYIYKYSILDKSSLRKIKMFLEKELANKRNLKTRVNRALVNGDREIRNINKSSLMKSFVKSVLRFPSKLVNSIVENMIKYFSKLLD